MTTPQDPTHRRSATRAPVGRPIKLQFDDSMDVIEGTCRNISIGGMYIVFDSSRPAGSLVRFELELEDGNAIRGLGEVVWMRSKSEHAGPEAGFGLKFRFLEQRDRQMIFKLVSHHIKDRLANREPAGGEPDAPAERLRASIAVPPEPAPAERPPSARRSPSPPEPEPAERPPEPEPADDAAPPPELAAPPASDLLSFDLEGLDLEAPLEPSAPVPEPPAAESPWADLEPPAALLEDPLLFEPETAPPPAPGGPPARRKAEGILGDEMSADLDSSLPDAFELAELDPSVGNTPLYELGLDPEPPSARARESEVPLDTPPPPLRSAQSSYLPPEPAAEAQPEEAAAAEEETSMGSYAASAAEPRRRQLAILPVVGVLVVAAAAAGYVFKDEILDRFGGGSVPAVESAVAPAALPAAADRARTAAQESAPPATESAPAAESAPPAAESAPPTAQSPSPEPVPLPPMQVEPPTPSPAPARASGPPATVAGAPAAGGFTRLLDISWREEGGALQVTLTADGTIPTGRFRYFHLAGDAPREVIKLLGVSQAFRQGELAIGGPGVRRIRTGFHRVQGANEQHVVIDLLGPRWTITEVRNLGSQLELTIAEP